MWFRAFLISALLCAAIGACAQARRAWTTEDDWYHPLPAGTLLAEWDPLDHDRVHEVIPERLPEAQELLQDLVIAELSPEQAASLIGATLCDAPGTKPYLVRGLLLNQATGSFAVYVLQDQIAVTHRSLGSSAAPMTRQPLVLQLEREPAQVHVTVSMAK